MNDMETIEIMMEAQVYIIDLGPNVRLIREVRKYLTKRLTEHFPE